MSLEKVFDVCLYIGGLIFLSAVICHFFFKLLGLSCILAFIGFVMILGTSIIWDNVLNKKPNVWDTHPIQDQT